MDVKIKLLGGLFMLSLLSVASLAAPSGDLRLVEAAKERDKERAASFLALLAGTGIYPCVPGGMLPGTGFPNRLSRPDNPARSSVLRCVPSRFA